MTKRATFKGVKSSILTIELWTQAKLRKSKSVVLKKIFSLILNELKSVSRIFGNYRIKSNTEIGIQVLVKGSYLNRIKSVANNKTLTNHTKLMKVYI